MSRIRLGKIVLEKTSFDLSQVVELTVSQMTTNQATPKIILRCQPGVIGNWDRRRIYQVIMNLVSNALKYGEGKPVEVEVDLEKTSGMARLVVRDFGMGISDELKLRLFERFERGVKPSRLTGLGLGLYITRQIVQAHNGTIDVESKIGKGSVFTVLLPTNGGSERS